MVKTKVTLKLGAIKLLIALMLTAGSLSAGLAATNSSMTLNKDSKLSPMTSEMMGWRVTQAEREAAADSLSKKRVELERLGLAAPMTAAALDPTATPDYFGMPNWANSPLPQIVAPGSALDYYTPWHDSVSMQSWVLMANPTGASNLHFNLSISGNPQILPNTFGAGAGSVSGGKTLAYTTPPGLLGGPVKATSLDGGQGVVSQRTLMGNSFEEVPATESEKLSDHFYWSWYDELSPGYQNWIVVNNPSATETVRTVITFIDHPTGQPVTGTHDIVPGGTWTPTFPGKMGGPVEIKAYRQGGSWPANARKVIASQRVLSNFGTAFNEVPGIPAGELSSKYLWTWYDMQSPGFINWVLIANPNAGSVTYSIKIAGTTIHSGSIPAGGMVTPTFSGQMGGPVEVIASGNVIASQRVIAGPSFEEVPGYPLTALSNTYRWTWYDMQSAGVVNWVLIANPNAGPVTYSIKIAGTTIHSGSIPAGGMVTPTFSGQMGGPVEVIASGNVIASQRVVWNGHFNEVLGIGGITPSNVGRVASGTGVRKFVDSLPGLGAGNANNLGQYIPVAIPDTTTYPGSDYYEIELVQYIERMHTDLPSTTLRGYRQTNTSDPTVSQPHYLGPAIVAQRDKPVRIKFTNKLPTGTTGDLFLPVDTSVMGAGMGPLDMPGMPGMKENYTQNRATLHLHGGLIPWISDGTPHQWTTPAGENTQYPKGVSVQYVPDIWFDANGNVVPSGTPDATNTPGDGSLTFYYNNQQSARLMFYHDHSYGITRLNVYAGEAAPYMLKDQVEQDLVSQGVIPADQIPLVIQDKTFVPDDTQLAASDPTWDKVKWGGKGNLWMPHVYMPNQNPADLGGMNAFGRWHYGPWFWPPTKNITHGPIPNPYYDPVNAPWEPPYMPGTPTPSMAMEAFMDTPVVNGTAYPYLVVQPKAYRFRILNAADDRFWNLQLYKANPAVTTLDGRKNTEVKMVSAIKTAGFPETWPTDGREGGVPDPTTAGPDMIQIGTEGGFLPAPVVIPNQPVDWNLDPTTFNMGNVSSHGLLLGTAERADVIIDFSKYAGKTLILYNDAPAPFPALDPRYDYYTGAPDLTDTGGAPSPLAGYGPNTRTIMQIKVAAATAAPAFDLAKLKTAFASSALTPGAFAASQDPILIPNADYNSAYNKSFPADTFARIFDTSLTVQTISGVTLTIPFEAKAIQDEQGEAFDTEYGRQSGFLGLQTPYTAPAPGKQNFILYPYGSPPVDLVVDSVTPAEPSLGDGTQIWKITHNGVDTHTIHFHLFNVQLINRVAWDNSIIPPDPNELGWKETLRVNPLEDTVVAMRPYAPTQPFKLPSSIRPIDPTMPIGDTLAGGPGGFFTPNADPVTVTNELVNFGWEYVYHCHLLAHEEMDMMHSMIFAVAPEAPSTLTATGASPAVNLSWIDNSLSETSFTVQWADAPDGPWTTLITLPFAAGEGSTVTYTDTSVFAGTRYYRVFAISKVGSTLPDFPNKTVNSAFSNTASN